MQPKKRKRATSTPSEIRFSWVFLNDLNDIRITDLPFEFYEEKTGKWYKDFFFEDLKLHYGFHAERNSILLWKPNEKFSEIPPQWKLQTPEIKRVSSSIHPTKSLLEAIGNDIERSSDDILVIVTANGTAAVSWFFWGHPKPNIQIVHLPLFALRCDMQDLQRTFSTELESKFKFNVDNVGGIRFYRPLELVSTIPSEWMTTDFQLDSVAKIIFPGDKLETIIKGDVKVKHLDLLVVAGGCYQADRNNTPATNAPQNQVSRLLESERFNRILQYAPHFPPPSSGSDPKVYFKSQSVPYQSICDGRYPSGGLPASLIAPPIQLFHPIFNFFLEVLYDDDIQPTIEDMNNTRELMELLGRIETPSGHEDVRNVKFTTLLHSLVDEDVPSAHGESGARPDGAFRAYMGKRHLVTYGFVELRKELGKGIGDPSVQAQLSMRNFWLTQGAAETLTRCCCPTLLISGGGPWLSVSGGVFTDKFIAQRLTSMEWMTLSTSEELHQVYHCARIMVALRTAVKKLKSYYENTVPGIPKVVVDVPHPRYFPYPQSYPDENGKVVKFHYLKNLQEHSACVTYLAEIQSSDNPTQIVVKYVSTYSPEVHKFLADKGHAPILRYYGEIPQWSPAPKAGRKTQPHIPPENHLTMYMVVMDYVDWEPYSNTLEDVRVLARTNLRGILEELHAAQLVFGDLRPPNILVAPDGQVNLIDFNWSGHYNISDQEQDPRIPADVWQKIQASKGWGQPSTGEMSYAHYPYKLSTRIEWTDGVKTFCAIRPEHDWGMFSKLR